MRALPMLLCAALALSGGALAKPRGKSGDPAAAQVADQLKEAERLYNVGKYVEAAELLEDVNRADPNPKLLYNIARAYDQAGELEKSLDYYQRYVSSKDGADATLLKRAVLSIDRIKGLMAKAEEERKKQEEERRRAEGEAAAAQARAAEEAELARKAMEESEARRQAELKAAEKVRSRDRVIAIAAGSVGIVGLGGGTVFGLLARGSKSQFDTATTVDDKRRLESQTKSQALIADLGFALGIAGAATAALMWPRGGDEAPAEAGAQRQEEASLRWFVSPAGASLRVRF